jgi:hypothetical protein
MKTIKNLLNFVILRKAVQVSLGSFFVLVLQRYLFLEIIIEN